MPATPPERRPRGSPIHACAAWTRAALGRFGLILVLAATGLAACQDGESAVVRGDRLWADSSYTSALAEYRLAVAREGDEEALARLAHALARMGTLDETREAYGRLLEESSAYRDQAVYDFLAIADRALARNDWYTAAAAMDEALALRPELVLRDGAREVGAWLHDRDQLDRALAYYRRALTAAPADSAPLLLYQIGVLEEELGECERAIDYFRAFRDQMADAGRRYWSLLGEARWHTGNCSFELAIAARDAGNVDTALEHLSTMIRLGVPESRLDRAWFERGELLLESGQYDEALAAYRRVLDRNPARTGRFVERAQQRIDEIRFGGGPSGPGFR